MSLTVSIEAQPCSLIPYHRNSCAEYGAFRLGYIPVQPCKADNVDAYGALRHTEYQRWTYIRPWEQEVAYRSSESVRMLENTETWTFAISMSD